MTFDGCSHLSQKMDYRTLPMGGTTPLKLLSGVRVVSKDVLAPCGNSLLLEIAA